MTRSEINRQNYLRSQPLRQAKARDRKRAHWTTILADWDQTNPPPESAIVAALLGQYTTESSWTEPLDRLIALEEAEA